MIDRTSSDELLAVSHAAGIVGEEMSLDLIAAGDNRELRVRVLDSRPVIIDGALRHRIRLSLVSASFVEAAGAAPQNAAETA